MSSHARESPLRWGILGLGRMAEHFAAALATGGRHRLVAVGSQSAERARHFARRFDALRGYAGYADLLADPEVEAVYVATPHTQHLALCLDAAKAGKHVLCEKPLALTRAAAERAFNAACHAERALLEAWMFRFHPLWEALRGEVRSGALGEVTHLEAAFGRAQDFDSDARVWRRELGGGALLDIGGYPVALARLVAQAACDDLPVEAWTVSGSALFADNGVDRCSLGTLNFQHRFMAQISASFCSETGSYARIYGTQAYLDVPNPFAQQTRDGLGYYRRIANADGRILAERRVGATLCPYLAEANYFADYLRQPARWPAARAFSLGNMATLERWRQAVGLHYPEAEGAQRHPKAYVQVPMAKPVESGEGRALRLLGESQLVLGVDKAMDDTAAFSLFDAFIDAGGRCFDTAQHYGDCEAQLGRWLRRRRLAEHVLVITKAGHTPHCEPAFLRHQVEGSLDRLGMSCLPMLLLHRDNLAFPASEFVNELEQLKAEGLIAAYGASNWATTRFDEAQAHAAPNSGFSLLSNQLAAARWHGPLWPGCVSAQDAATQAWLTSRQVPLLPWASQAQGFFAQAQTAHASLAERWWTPDNLARKAAFEKVAADEGISTTCAALRALRRKAYPCFPVIGPRTPAELRDSMRARD